MLSAENPYLIESLHPDYLGQSVSFAELATGAQGPQRGCGEAKWLGSFRGRPQLAEQLKPALTIVLAQSKPYHIARRLQNFRAIWRLMDRLEKEGFSKVEKLEDLSAVHGTQWLRSDNPPAQSVYSVVRATFEIARELAGLEPLVWISNKHSKPKVNDIASPEQTHKVYLGLKRRVFAVYDDWRHSDLLAERGRNLLQNVAQSRLPPSQVSAADLHASYRALIELTGNPIPSQEEFVTAMGYSPFRKCGEVRRFQDIFFKAKSSMYQLRTGLYPSYADSQHILYLFLIQTGWNLQVALDLDVSNDSWAVPIGDKSSEVYRLTSFKTRAGTWQRTLSRGKPSHAPYQLIRRIIARSSALRESIRAGQTGVAHPTVATRSPWLFVTDGRDPIVSILDDKNYHRAAKTNMPYLRDLARELNASIGPENSGRAKEVDSSYSEKKSVKVPENMRVGDFRDIYIGNEFLQSGYNMVIAKLAAGHSSMRSVRHYLSSRAWRRHSEGSVRRLMDHLWGEVEIHRVCDPAILRALCERGSITDEQRTRWLNGKDRTYLGMGCADPKNPPSQIDPTHEDGNVCRNQHRCVLCEHGIVFPESLSDLCKRLAEIKILREMMPLVTWTRASDLRSEEQRLIGTLAQFDREKVDESLSNWMNEIRAGRHFVLEWGGVHG